MCFRSSLHIRCPCCTSLRCGVNWDMFILSSWIPDRPLRMQERKCHSGVWIYTMTWACTCKEQSFISAPKTTSNYLNYSSLGSHSGAHLKCSNLCMQSLLIELTVWRCHFDRLTCSCAGAIMTCLASHSDFLRRSWEPSLRWLQQHTGSAKAVGLELKDGYFSVFMLETARAKDSVPGLCFSLARLLQPLLETEQWAPQSFVSP